MSDTPPLGRRTGFTPPPAAAQSPPTEQLPVNIPKQKLYDPDAHFLPAEKKRFSSDAQLDPISALIARIVAFVRNLLGYNQGTPPKEVEMKEKEPEARREGAPVKKDSVPIETPSPAPSKSPQAAKKLDKKWDQEFARATKDSSAVSLFDLHRKIVEEKDERLDTLKQEIETTIEDRYKAAKSALGSVVPKEAKEAQRKIKGAEQKLPALEVDAEVKEREMKAAEAAIQPSDKNELERLPEAIGELLRKREIKEKNEVEPEEKRLNSELDEFHNRIDAIKKQNARQAELEDKDAQLKVELAKAGADTSIAGRLKYAKEWALKGALPKAEAEELKGLMTGAVDRARNLADEEKKLEAKQKEIDQRIKQLRFAKLTQLFDSEIGKLEDRKQDLEKKIKSQEQFLNEKTSAWIASKGALDAVTKEIEAGRRAWRAASQRETIQPQLKEYGRHAFLKLAFDAYKKSDQNESPTDFLRKFASNNEAVEKSFTEELTAMGLSLSSAELKELYALGNVYGVNS